MTKKKPYDRRPNPIRKHWKTALALQNAKKKLATEQQNQMSSVLFSRSASLGRGLFLAE